jgi:hypothetical protein
MPSIYSVARGIGDSSAVSKEGTERVTPCLLCPKQEG